jgi:EAL domain-containing protein (putative c-di-GMP-specific phosphodiesterase class I)
LISPAQFIPVLEEGGMIEALGEWVLKTACAEARTWPGRLHVAVNVSPLQIKRERFFGALCISLLRTGLPPNQLELEITESAFLNDQERMKAELENWSSLGVRIALDDFGSGYSSLGYLDAFPIDKIKIDRHFISRLDTSDPDGKPATILKSIIDLGHGLGKTITAEGVERADQLDYLARLACTQVQGYFMGKPVPASDLNQFFPLIEPAARRIKRA